MRERKDYCSFSLNSAHFTLKIVGPRPAAKVRNEQQWRFCSAPTLQPSTLSHAVAQRPKASYHAGMSCLDALFIVNLLLTRQKSMSLRGFGR